LSSNALSVKIDKQFENLKRCKLKLLIISFINDDSFSLFDIFLFSHPDFLKLIV